MAPARFIDVLSSRWNSACSLLRKGFETPAHRLPPGTLLEIAYEDSARLGKLGEAVAARHLKKVCGYKILYRNFRAPHGGEVDIVCRHRDTLVFVEVKTRFAVEFGVPSEAVNLEKQRLIARGAMHWLKLLGFPEIPFRFDILEAVLGHDGVFRFDLIENAFPLPEPLIY